MSNTSINIKLEILFFNSYATSYDTSQYYETVLVIITIITPMKDNDIQPNCNVALMFDAQVSQFEVLSNRHLLLITWSENKPVGSSAEFCVLVVSTPSLWFFTRSQCFCKRVGRSHLCSWRSWRPLSRSRWSRAWVPSRCKNHPAQLSLWAPDWPTAPLTPR